MRFPFVALLSAAGLALAACQQDGPQTGAAGVPGARSEQVSFGPYLPPNLQANLQPPSLPETIPATLRLPEGEGRFPAVVILHGSGGVDGRGEQYARAFAAVGIASLEVDMWAARGISNRDGIARRPSHIHAMPDAYGALRFLASHPRIIADRIGAMGMSFGANLSVSVASDRVGKQYANHGPDFQAVMPLYPACWGFEPGERRARLVDRGFPRIPLLLMIGDRDDYDADGGNSCRNLTLIGTPAARQRASFHVFPGATHGWERLRGSVRYQDPAAARGRGGWVYVERNDAVTQESIRRAVAFFQENLGAR
jgi:dienelactone hydrolase